MTTRREKEQQVVIEGRVVADFGREFLVEFADRRQVVCTRKGKRQDATCGDFVEVRLTGSAQGSIERIGTRRNLLYRSDQWREKMLAANVDQVVILLAPKPPFSEAFLNLSLVACEAARLPVPYRGVDPLRGVGIRLLRLQFRRFPVEGRVLPMLRRAGSVDGRVHPGLQERLRRGMGAVRRLSESPRRYPAQLRLGTGAQ